jgi:hypothetical protein
MAFLILLTSLLQRFGARLENIHWDEDGEKLCATAPYDFLGMHFDTPLTCTYWVCPLFYLYLNSSLIGCL